KVDGKSSATGNYFGQEAEAKGKAEVRIKDVKTGGIGILSISRRTGIKKTQGFELDAVYSYPNPAKQKEPTIHVDCGVSDASVKLKIYTIAGELVHEKDISSFYNSSKNAYEYTWDTSGKASGVYIYLIKATRDGKTLKKTGKIGLIK
ncbi:MAG: T9SS type A sorting domain-containing protein, partial [Elusimicrobia bacterium]|nr:T9SS type A sorting domain-containing protein [Elusimicrobiota bacterium]